uniref:Receptor ligand binding region domain-containing protein n=1 Tax=Trichogramma kaykai TaxID=54128 RepID=A0ABD2XSJ7_9HYME
MRGKFLAAIDVDYVKLNKSINLSFQAMVAALRNNQKLKVLFLHDCVAFDFLTHLDSVVDAIFSDSNALYAVAWTFSEPQRYPDLKQDFVLLFNLTRLHVLLGSIPNVVELSKINIKINEKCNFANVRFLKRLTISWASDIENVLVGLPPESLRTLRLTSNRKCPPEELDLLLPIVANGVEECEINERDNSNIIASCFGSLEKHDEDIFTSEEQKSTSVNVVEAQQASTSNKNHDECQQSITIPYQDSDNENFSSDEDLCEELAYVDLVKALNWKSFTIIYENNEGLVRLQELLKAYGPSHTSINIKQLGEDALNGHGYSSLFLLQINKSST